MTMRLVDTAKLGQRGNQVGIDIAVNRTLCQRPDIELRPHG
jgi:hypothetical protein